MTLKQQLLSGFFVCAILACIMLIADPRFQPTSDRGKAYQIFDGIEINQYHANGMLNHHIVAKRMIEHQNQDPKWTLIDTDIDFQSRDANHYRITAHAVKINQDQTIMNLANCIITITNKNHKTHKMIYAKSLHINMKKHTAYSHDRVSFKQNGQLFEAKSMFFSWANHHHLAFNGLEAKIRNK